MRCLGSSPAAALSALRNRAANEADRLEPQIYDEDGDDEDAVDIAPSTAFADDPALRALIDQAGELVEAKDPKLDALVGALKPLIKSGANPVVFCRYLATAEHVKSGLRKAFPKLIIESVTGELTPDERRDRVAEMALEDAEEGAERIVVATDCLSEGINLQQLFDTVVHYDLSWNPTRATSRPRILRATRQSDARLGASEAKTGAGNGMRTSEPGRGIRKRDSNPSNFRGLNFLSVYMGL
jgi:hypothetical protein